MIMLIFFVNSEMILKQFLGTFAIYRKQNTCPAAGRW